MTPKQKADEIISSFINSTQIFIEYPEDKIIQKSVAKNAALQAMKLVNEAIDDASLMKTSKRDFWKQVKTEIENI